MSLREYVEKNVVDEKTFGNYLKKRRESLGMSIRGLAAELKVSAATSATLKKETGMHRHKRSWKGL